ncbi:hypothetical protein Celaphus_00016391 [Cervus elaphus hippelaphus]|uniref:Uncharacterized protein n=1 Tax=Cervus elaphus hippelaphus TaxID=46360 RepID=A0A212CEN5_CEREH|nr:hypothetical protein Celaphus_00016391 [Cervus elaphus hippelaphus]
MSSRSPSETLSSSLANALQLRRTNEIIRRLRKWTGHPALKGPHPLHKVAQLRSPAVACSVDSVPTLEESKEVQLVVVARDVDPLNWWVSCLPCVVRWGFPTVSSRGRTGWVACVFHRKTCTVAFTQVNSEDKGTLAKLSPSRASISFRTSASSPHPTVQVSPRNSVGTHSAECLPRGVAPCYLLSSLSSHSQMFCLLDRGLTLLGSRSCHLLLLVAGPHFLGADRREAPLPAGDTAFILASESLGITTLARLHFREAPIRVSSPWAPESASQKEARTRGYVNLKKRQESERTSAASDFVRVLKSLVKAAFPRGQRAYYADETLAACCDSPELPRVKWAALRLASGVTPSSATCASLQPNSQACQRFRQNDAAAFCSFDALLMLTGEDEVLVPSCSSLRANLTVMRLGRRRGPGGEGCEGQSIPADFRRAPVVFQNQKSEHGRSGMAAMKCIGGGRDSGGTPEAETPPTPEELRPLRLPLPGSLPARLLFRGLGLGGCAVARA